MRVASGREGLREMMRHCVERERARRKAGSSVFGLSKCREKSRAPAASRSLCHRSHRGKASSVCSGQGRRLPCVSGTRTALNVPRVTPLFHTGALFSHFPVRQGSLTFSLPSLPATHAGPGTAVYDVPALGVCTLPGFIAEGLDPSGAGPHSLPSFHFVSPP